MCPRSVQISVNHLLIVVALVALNCGVLRSVYGTVAQVHGGYPLLSLSRNYGPEDGSVLPLPPLSFAVGLIPVLDILFFGIVMSMAGRRPKGRRTRPEPTIFLAGILVPDHSLAGSRMRRLYVHTYGRRGLYSNGRNCAGSSFRCNRAFLRAIR
jgi:hypothetical protein